MTILRVRNPQFHGSSTRVRLTLVSGCHIWTTPNDLHPTLSAVQALYRYGHSGSNTSKAAAVEPP